MRMRKWFGSLVIGALLCACAAPDASSLQAGSAGPEVDSMGKGGVTQAALDATANAGGEAVAVQGSDTGDRLAVVVRYKSEGVAVPVCSVFVVERIGNSKKMETVEKSDAVIECPLALAADVVRQQIGLKVGGKKIELADENEKGRSMFEFERTSGGGWMLSRANFIRTEEDFETGDVVVISEIATYSDKSKKIRLSDYNYDSIRSDLVKSVIE